MPATAGALHPHPALSLKGGRFYVAGRLSLAVVEAGIYPAALSYFTCASFTQRFSAADSRAASSTRWVW